MTTSSDPKRSEWILLALLAADGHELTAVKLQKALFLLGERRKRSVGSDYYIFRPYHYGPFDADVYHDADWLEHDGLIKVNRSQGRSLRTYALTDRGISTAGVAAKRRPPKACAYLAKVVGWAQPLPFDMLVRAIYEEYPDMRVNSIFDQR